MRRKSRLFALAEALRARRTGVTAQQLADRFGVTLRTIYRDLEALQDAGMPIKADRGRGGGYALDKSYQLPPINFTAREAALLLALSRLAIEQRLIPFPNAIEKATDKVRAALSTSAQRELLTWSESCSSSGPCPANPRDRSRCDRDRVVRVARPAHRLREEGVGADAGSCGSEASYSIARSRCSTAPILETGNDRQFRLDKIKQATVMDTHPS